MGKHINTEDSVSQPKGAYGNSSGLTPTRARRQCSVTLSGRKDGDGAKEPKWNKQPTDGGTRGVPRGPGSHRDPLTSSGRSDYLNVGPAGQKGSEPANNTQPYGIKTTGSVPKCNKQPTEA